MTELGDFQTFGERLGQLMKLAGVSSDELAKRLGHSHQSSVSEYLNDRVTPRGPTVGRLCDALEHPEWAGWLLNGAGPMPVLSAPELGPDPTWTAYVQRRIAEYQADASVASSREKQKVRRAIAEGVSQIVTGITLDAALAVTSIFLDPIQNGPTIARDEDEDTDERHG